MAAAINTHKVVYATRDAHGLIFVAEDATGTMRTLHFDTPIEQSRYYLNAPFTLGFEYLQVAFDRLMQPTPSSLLCLGLGGGRLNTQLHYALPQCQQQIIELRPQIVHIAHEWFDLPQTVNIAVETADAFFAVQKLSTRYESIFVDLFDGHGMPSQFSTDSFMTPLLAACQPGGRILMNLWRTDPAVRHMLLPWLQAEALNFTLHKIKSSPNWILEIIR